MRFFGNKVPKEQEVDQSLLARLYQLERAVEALQIDSAERQLTVLNACEKVLHQLSARERKRVEENPSEEAPETTIPFRGDTQVPRRRSNY